MARLQKDVPIIEHDQCKCEHGNARHSEKVAGQGQGRVGRLCLIPDCPCYKFRLDLDLVAR